jgi:hypothetical protein
VHSISLPPGKYGGDEIERLFTNRLDWDAHPYFQQIRGAGVVPLLIRRDGELLQFVSCEDRAWHAGARLAGRENCNDYSIGIELEGLEGERFEAGAIRCAGEHCCGLAQRYPIASAWLGHEHIAPAARSIRGLVSTGSRPARLAWSVFSRGPHFALADASRDVHSSGAPGEALRGRMRLKPASGDAFDQLALSGSRAPRFVS